jgi:hypothetical protein
MLNLLILILLEIFEEFHSKSDSSWDIYFENIEKFQKHWKAFPFKEGNFKIKEKNLLPFFINLPPPLGWSRSDLDFVNNIKLFIKLNIPM